MNLNIQTVNRSFGRCAFFPIGIRVLGCSVVLLVGTLSVGAFTVPAYAASNSPAIRVIPRSSAGCTPWGTGRFGWCIAIQGTGLKVAWVKTSGFTDISGCSVAQLLVNGAVAYSMPQVCYKGGTITTTSGTDYTATMLSADFVINTSFTAGTVLCEQYQGNGISGGTSPRACETVE